VVVRLGVGCGTASTLDAKLNRYCTKSTINELVTTVTKFSR